MIKPVLVVLLSLAATVTAQSTLQLPDVTLFGEYTLYLAAPPPPPQQIPAATAFSDDRLSYPRSLFKVDLAAPGPPVLYWQRIPRSLIAPPGLLPDSPAGDPSRYAGSTETPAGHWQASVDYIPGAIVSTEVASSRSSGVWDLAAELDFNLADGWVTTTPDFPTDLTFALQARRRALALNVDAAVNGGAFYGAGAAGVYTLGLGTALSGDASPLRWAEHTQLYGISGIGGGTPPADPDVQRGAVQQDIELSLAGSRWELSLRSRGVLAAGVPSSVREEHGRASLELGWQPSSRVLLLRAGGAALYYDESLTFYPSGGVQFYPVDFMSVSVHGAPFIRQPPPNVQALTAVEEAFLGSSTAHLQTEGGYSLYAEVRVDTGAVFATSLSFEWIDGRIYLLDASDRAVRFTGTNQGVLQGDLTWQVSPANPGIRFDLNGELAAAFPLTGEPWRNALYSNAGLVWTTDFHKPPVEFIIKALIGDYADDGSKAFLFTDWEIVSGLMTSIEGNWKIGQHGAIHGGVEAFLHPDISFRFLFGYGIRR
jgi:hypothetical protein